MRCVTATSPQANAAPTTNACGQQPASEDTTLAVLVDLSILAFGLIGPLAPYLIEQDSSPFTRHHAAEALNFHITLAVAAVVSAVLLFVLIGFALLPAVAIAGVVSGVIAAVAAVIAGVVFGVIAAVAPDAASTTATR